MKKRLITAALPYVNNVPHLGNLIQVLSADAFARFCRLRGYETCYVCGTDEYGTATETRAAEEGITPRELCDRYWAIHDEIYRWFNISFDKFGRTSTPVQTEIVQDMFKKLDANGFISEKTIEQLYCPACDRFLADRYVRGTCPHCGYDGARGDQCESCGKLLDPTDLKAPRCASCNAAPELRETKHLYIELPRLKEKLEAWIAATAGEGGWARNAVQMTQAWIRDGLHERAITRDLKWGIPVPKAGFENKVFYVWFDAPIGYVSITGNLAAERGLDWRAFVDSWWKNPSNVELFQFIGKDNIPFHTVIFPSSQLGTGENWTMLRHMSSTEYLNYESGKFSKSKGIGVFGTDTMETGIAADIWRFAIFYNRPEKSDALFTWKEFGEKTNAELIGNLANLVNRTLSFVTRYYGGKIPGEGGWGTSGSDSVLPGGLGERERGTGNGKQGGGGSPPLRSEPYGFSATPPAGDTPATPPKMGDGEWGMGNGEEEKGNGEQGTGNRGLDLHVSTTTGETHGGNKNLNAVSPSSPQTPNPIPHPPLLQTVLDLEAKITAKLERAELRDAYRMIFELSSFANKTFQNGEPWKKRVEDPPAAAALIGNLCHIVRDLAIMIEPFTPQTAERIAGFLGKTFDRSAPGHLVWSDLGKLSGLDRVLSSEILFTKLEAKTMDAMREKYAGTQEERGMGNGGWGMGTSGSKSVLPGKLGGSEKGTGEFRSENPLSHETQEAISNQSPHHPSSIIHHPSSSPHPPSSLLDLRVAKIIKIEKHPKADKLYIETLEIAGEERIIVSGLVPYYREEELLNKHIIVAYNLKAAKLRGVPSRGMLLAASCKNEDGTETVEFLDAGVAPTGTRVSFEDEKGMGYGVGGIGTSGSQSFGLPGELTETTKPSKPSSPQTPSSPPEIDIDTFFSVPITVKDYIVNIEGKALMVNGVALRTVHVANGSVG